MLGNEFSSSCSSVILRAHSIITASRRAMASAFRSGVICGELISKFNPPLDLAQDKQRLEVVDVKETTDLIELIHVAANCSVKRNSSFYYVPLIQRVLREWNSGGSEWRPRQRLYGFFCLNL